MSERTKEFEAIRYTDKSLPEAERDRRRERKKELLKAMTEEEFAEIIKNTIGPKAKEAYRQVREE